MKLTAKLREIKSKVESLKETKYRLGNVAVRTTSCCGFLEVYGLVLQASARTAKELNSYFKNLLRENAKGAMFCTAVDNLAYHYKEVSESLTAAGWIKVESFINPNTTNTVTIWTFTTESEPNEQRA